jgi:hypothetical protein
VQDLFDYNNKLLNDEGTTVSDKVDKLEKNLMVSDKKLILIDSLAKEYSRISGENIYERRDSLVKQNSRFKDQLTELKKRNLTPTITETQEFLIKKDFETRIGYLRQIEKNVTSLISNRKIGLDERLKKLMEYKVLSETQIRLLNDIIEKNQHLDRNYNFKKSLSQVDNLPAKIESISKDIKLIAEIYKDELIKRKQSDSVLDSLNMLLISPNLSNREIEIIEMKFRLRNQQIEDQLNSELESTMRKEIEYFGSF